MTLHREIDPHDNIAWGPNGRASDVPPFKNGPNPLEDDAPLVPNRTDIEIFLRDCVGTIIHVVSIKPDAAEDDPDKTHGRYFGDAAGDAVSWLATENVGGRNCYWTVNVTAVGLNKKPSKNDIAAARFAHADIDPPKEGAGMDKAATLAGLLALDLVPSFVVDSGNGLQPLWRLAYAPKEWKQIENINRAIAKKLGADSCYNIDRLLRVPGTINWPDATKRTRGRVPVLSRLAYDGGRDSIYTPDELARVFPPIPGPDKESKTSGEDIGEIELLTPDDLGLSSLCPLRSVIEHPTGKDRSKDGIRAAGDLLRAGFAKLQVLGILLNPKNKVSAHYLDQTDPRRAALRTLQWLEEHKSDEAKGQDDDSGSAGAQSSGTDKGEKPKASLKWLNMSNWDGEPVPKRQWAIRDRVPLNQAGLFSGEGGTGKSIIELMKNVAHVTGKDWLGSLPEQGPAFYLGAEDDEDEIHIRLAAIGEHYGTTFKELIDGKLHVLPLLGQDATLCAVTQGGKVEVTGLYNQLFEAAGDIKPKNISIDTLSRAFAGNELDRHQVYAFAMRMQALAKVAGASVTVLSHPSLAGIASGSGISGSTAWHGAFRFRQYLKTTKPDSGEQPDNDLRELDFKKNQYGPLGESMVLRYQRGLFLPEGGVSSLDKLAREATADRLFLDMLRRFAGQGRYVSDKPTANGYAPTAFAEDAEAKKHGLRKADFKTAMARLFGADKIYVENYGRPSRPASRLSEKRSTP